MDLERCSGARWKAEDEAVFLGASFRLGTSTLVSYPPAPMYGVCNRRFEPSAITTVIL